MASTSMHIAIAKKYLEKHPDLDYFEFIDGAIYPDESNNKDPLHYSGKDRTGTNRHILDQKVNLYDFLKEREGKELTTFELGWFQHLVADYLFFGECFSDDYLSSKTFKEFIGELYYAYDRINLYVKDKYNITREDYMYAPFDKYPNMPYEDCILPRELVDSFIDRVSSIDLQKYMPIILKAKTNVKPESK